MLKNIFGISLVSAFFSLSPSTYCFNKLCIDFLYYEKNGIYAAEIKVDNNQPKTLVVKEKDENSVEISQEVVAYPNEQQVGTYDLFLNGDKNSIPFCSIDLLAGNVSRLSKTSSLSDQSMILVNGQPWLYDMDTNNVDNQNPYKKTNPATQATKPIKQGSKNSSKTVGEERQQPEAVTPVNTYKNPYGPTEKTAREKSVVMYRELKLENILLKPLSEIPHFEPSNKHFTYFGGNNTIGHPRVQGDQPFSSFQYTPISRADYEQIRLNSKEVITLPDGSIDTAFEIPNGGGGLNSCFFMSAVPYRFLQHIYGNKNIGTPTWGRVPDPARTFIMKKVADALFSDENNPKINEIKSWGLLAVKQGCDNKGKNENEHLGQKREFCTQALKYAIEQQNGMSSEMYPEYDILYSDCNRDIKLWDNPEIHKRWNEMHAVNAEILRTLYKKETADFCNKWSTSRVQLETDWNVPGFASIVGAIFNINVIIFANTNITHGGETLQKGTTLSTYYLPNASSTVCIGYHLGHYSKYVTISQIYTFLQAVAGDDSGNMPTFEDFSSYMLASGKLPDINEKTWITQLLADVVSRKPEPKASSSKVVPMKSVAPKQKLTTPTMMNKVDMQNSEITTTPANPVTKEQEKKLIISKKNESKISLAETTPVEPVAPQKKLTAATTIKKVTSSQSSSKKPAPLQATIANKSSQQNWTLEKAQSMAQTLQKDLSLQIDPAELQMYLNNGGENPFGKKVETTKWSAYIQDWYKRFRATVDKLKENTRRNEVLEDRNIVSAAGSISKNETSGGSDQAAQKRPVIKRQVTQNTENKPLDGPISKLSSAKPNVANKGQVSQSTLSTKVPANKENSTQIGEVSKEQNSPAQKRPVKRKVIQNTENKPLDGPISKLSSIKTNVANKGQVPQSTLSTKVPANKGNSTQIGEVSKKQNSPAQKRPVIKRQTIQDTENKPSDRLVSKLSSTKPNVANKGQVPQSTLSTKVPANKGNSTQIGEVSKKLNHAAQKQPVIKRQITKNTENQPSDRPVSKLSSPKPNVANKRQVSQSALNTTAKSTGGNLTQVKASQKPNNQQIKKETTSNTNIKLSDMPVNPYKLSNTPNGFGSTPTDLSKSMNPAGAKQITRKTNTPSTPPSSSKSQLDLEELYKTQRENVIWTLNTINTRYGLNIDGTDYMDFIDDGGTEPALIDDKEYIVNEWYKNQYLKWKNSKTSSTKSVTPSGGNNQAPRRNAKK